MKGDSQNHGVTLVDTLVACALFLVVFLGIVGAFKLAIDVVINNKARAGAIALLNEREEFLQSISYDSIGTAGGIPSGAIPQTESVSLNNVPYIRRTFIEYEDDPKDGLGVSDTNNIVEDYKQVKIDVSWYAKGGVRHVVSTTRISPTNGLESAVPGGTLLINVINSLGAPVFGAAVSIVNASLSPAVALTTFTDASGTAVILGAPAGSGYQISTTYPGYSTSTTYSVTAQNTNPNPANLTVALNTTTSGTFAIDLLSTKIIQTWIPIQNGTFVDTFANANFVSTTTNISFVSGSAQLSGVAPYTSPGSFKSILIASSSLASWGMLTTNDTRPNNTNVLYRVFDGTGTTLIPDAQIPGNAAGMASSSINLSLVSTSTYPSLVLGATLTTSVVSSTPLINSWSVSYATGPLPLPNITVLMRGSKSVGTGPSGAVYKYATTANTMGSTASSTISNLEWDAYILSVSSTTGYDISSVCNPQPETLAPNTTQTSRLYLSPHTSNSLLVDVHTTATGALIPNAFVTITKSGFTATSTTDQCGQSFFSSLVSGTYNISVTALGQSNFSASGIPVGGTNTYTVSMN